MSKQFTAHIPARTVKGQTKSFSYAAREDTYSCDDAGQWYGTRVDELVKMEDADVIDACKPATNWAEIRAIYFPMYGFHAPEGDWDKTPANKRDY